MKRVAGALLAIWAGLMLAPTVTAAPESEPAPALHLPDLEGGTHTLEEWRGKVILLNFWASWCAPCQSEIRELIRFQEELGERGFQVIGVGVDDARKLANVRRTLGIGYPVLAANPADEKLLKQWGDEKGVIPYNVVIDRDGRIRESVRGSFDRTALDELVVPLLSP